MTYDDLLESIHNSAALRLRLRLQPLYGEGETVFPPTYADTTYLLYERRVPGREEAVPCAILDSVQSQANRMEEALMDDIRSGNLDLPHIRSDFSGVENLIRPIGTGGSITSLEAPHRVFDAILRDSELDGQPFPLSPIGEAIRKASARYATPLFQYDPCSLLFGSWDSTGPSGGMGEKFTRCVVSEIVAVNAKQGERRGLRRDPLNTSLVEVTTNGKTRIIESVGKTHAKKADNKKRASEANHSHIPWGRDKPEHGGVTMEYATQSATISIPALRRLRFPLVEGEDSKPEVDAAAHAVLAAVAIHAIALNVERGWHLRSRCDLFPEDGSLRWERLAGASGAAEETLQSVEASTTRDLLKSAIDAARELSLPWEPKPTQLVPGEALKQLAQKSQKAQAESGGDD